MRSALNNLAIRLYKVFSRQPPRGSDSAVCAGVAVAVFENSNTRAFSRGGLAYNSVCEFNHPEK